jgi:hypothetical protein
LLFSAGYIILALRKDKKADNNGMGKTNSSGAAVRTIKLKASERRKFNETIKRIFNIDKPSLVRFINSIFGKLYDPLTAIVVFLSTEHIKRDKSKTYSDMMFSIDGVVYHIEFQTLYDKTMVLRFFEYGAAKALDLADAGALQERVVFEFPSPLLIQLEKGGKTSNSIPAAMKISGRSDVYEFDIPVIKVWEYELKAMVEREWYLLLPFILMRYMRDLNSAEDIDALRSALNDIDSAIYKLAVETDEKERISGELAVTLEEALLYLKSLITEKYIKDTEKKKEIDDMATKTMFLADRVKAEGRAEGKAEGKAEIVTLLHDSGMSTEDIAQRLRTSNEKIKEYLKIAQTIY